MIFAECSHLLFHQGLQKLFLNDYNFQMFHDLIFRSHQSLTSLSLISHISLSSPATQALDFSDLTMLLKLTSECSDIVLEESIVTTEQQTPNRFKDIQNG